LDIILNFTGSYWLAVIGAGVLLGTLIYYFFFMHISGEHKLAKLSKYEIEHIDEYINRVNGDLNSLKHDRVSYHHQRLTELLNTIDKESGLKKNKKLRTKMQILEYKAGRCKKRLDESMKGQISGNEIRL